MSRTVSPVSGRPYGLAAVCRAWRAPRATVYRRRVPPLPQPLQRPGPVGPMPDAALLVAIRAVVAASPFHGEGHRKIWARLRIAGVRTSKRRVLRLMRENDLLAPSRVGTPRGPRSHDGTIIPETVDTMWGTDLTTTIIGEGQVAVFIAIDHCSAECVGIHAAQRATRFEALEPIRQSLPPRRRGACATISAASPGTSPAVSPSGMITDRNTWPTPSRTSSPSSASKARPPSFARRRETAVPSALSER
jgi:putative transposase